MIKFINVCCTYHTMNVDKLEQALKRGIRGKYTHIDPLKALEGLTADSAAIIPPKGWHSCWHLLYHIVYWQELMLAALRGEKVNWPKNNDLSWPSENTLKQSNEWAKLVQKFEEGLIEADKHVEKTESFEDLPSWPKVAPFAAIMVIAQHNSFHMGEIVATRQALGLWPPPEYKATF
jgi:uncharacterized damage-inducible protein DinB